MGPLIVLVAMFALLWVLVFMPQRRRAQVHRALIESVEVGDEIVTVGGLIGRVRSKQDEELVLEIAPGTQVRVARRAVASVLSPGNEGKHAEIDPAGEQDEEAHS